MFYMNNYSRKSLIIIMMTFFDENTILINVSMTFIIHVYYVIAFVFANCNCDSQHTNVKQINLNDFDI